MYKRQGQYSAGDGNKYQLSGDTGIGFADGRGSVHVAGQIVQQDESNRAGPYQGTTPNTSNFPNIGQTTFVVGDPRVDATAASANASFQFSDHVSAYATAMASNRDITSFAFYRSRNNLNQGALLARITTQLGLKAAGHGLHFGQTGLTPHLASIGG